MSPPAVTMKTSILLIAIAATTLAAQEVPSPSESRPPSGQPALAADDPTLVLAKHPEPPKTGRHEKPVPREVPISAQPAFMEAVTIALKTHRDDPEVKAAEAALAATQIAGPSPAQDEAILKLEAILVEKAKGLKPAAKDVLDRRASEVKAQLQQIEAAKKK
jgi:hypothetical protein